MLIIARMKHELRGDLYNYSNIHYGIATINFQFTSQRRIYIYPSIF